MNNPLVSICCLSYNQAKFIEQSLNSFLRQEVNFEIEVLINDDASTDGTQEIILDYSTKYPKVIKPLIQSKNQYSQGVRSMQNRFNFSRAKGKYIALCEGDDYWSDTQKLQKQIDFLESNLDYNLCFHQVDMLYDNGNTTFFCNITTDTTLFRKDLYASNIVPTCSAVYRFIDRPDIEGKKGLTFGDWLMHLHYTKSSKAFYFAKSMGVYRVHKGGYWSTQKRTDQYEQILNVCRYIDNNLVDTEDEKSQFIKSHQKYFLLLIHSYFKEMRFVRMFIVLGSWIKYYSLGQVLKLIFTSINRKLLKV